MKRIIIFALLLTTLSSTAKDVKTYLNGTRQHGGARSVVPSVMVDQEPESVTVEISRYCGEFAIYIYDEFGNAVSNKYGVAEGNASDVLNTEALPAGNYTLTIVLGDLVYSGEFYITK